MQVPINKIIEFVIPCIIFSLSAVLMSCSVSVTPPTTEVKQQENQIFINKSFDETWEAMIEYVSNSYFGIDSFEKDSGLLTLAFGSDNPGRYIDCGSTSGPNYSGPFAEEANSGRSSSHQLEGKMNVLVTSEGPNVTKIRVTARYVYTYQVLQYRQVWAFNTNTSDTKSIGRAKGITCLSKQVAEKDLLEGIKLSASKK